MQLSLKAASLKKDQIHLSSPHPLASFEFNAAVAEVFDDMVHRSVPFYAEVQAMQLDLLARCVGEEGALCDLGCSTGTLLARIQQDERLRFRELVGVDDSQAMLAQAKAKLRATPERLPLRLLRADLLDCPLPPSSALLMNYTLQFIRPPARPALLARLCQTLVPGGLLLLSEKVLGETAFTSRLAQEMYLLHKRRQGYSDLEIARKRDQLEHVLVPYKVSEQVQLLQQAGFAEVELFFKWHNFAAFLAIKRP